MQAVFILDGCRTPVGRYGGVLASERPDDLLAFVLRKVLERNPHVEPTLVDEVIAGAANQAGEDNRNVARMAALLAGLPTTVPGYTVNRLCASGLQAVVDGFRMIALGEADIVLAGGTESMSRAPYVISKATAGYERSQEMHDTTIGWRFTNPKLAANYPPYSMGETAENVAVRYSISREDQDAFAWQSQQRWKAAHDAERFAAEIVPYICSNRKGETIVSTDEHPRPETTLDKLAALKPAFREGGSVTAGNASGVNDGAAALILVSERAATRLNLKPKVRIVGSASAGVDPAYMGVGPVPAVRKLLKLTGWQLADVGRFELNEAFAAQSLACIRELGIDPAIVNVNGGAIAIGHPLGCSGARLATTLLHDMERSNIARGIATLCVGVGQGLALALERA